MRTKFLCSLVLVTAGLTCATLLVMRHAAQVHLQKEIEEDARNAITAFQVMQHQHQIALSHKADLLATIAQIRDGDASTIQDSSEDPWQSDDCNLFALADRDGKITALHTTTPGFPVAIAEEMLRRSFAEHNAAGWWYGGARLYQVVLQPIYDGGTAKNIPVGTVVVGHEIDAREANDLRKISSTQVVFRYGGEVVISTFPLLREWELTQQVQDGLTREPIDRERFWATSVELTHGTRPAVTLTVLKSYKMHRHFWTD